MAEGTKLGEYSNDLRFNPAVSVDLGQEAEQLTGTRIGEMSEFEKSLYTQEELAKKQQEAEKARQVREAVRREMEAGETGREARKASLGDSDLFADEFESFLDYKEGDVVKGVVRGMAKGGLLVDFGYKADGFVPSNEISDDANISLETVKPGEEIDVYIERLETKEGCSILSMKRAEYEVAWNQIMTIAKTKEMIDVRVVSRVEGGFVAEYYGIRGFIPASHIITDSPEDAESLVGQDITVVVLQADRKRRKVVFSNKLARQRSSRGDARKVLESIQVGETRKGTVS
ncbi:MAG: S1 RNA-binding domain-containing protein, partial [Candidatus Margulisiibacteriota bacterium]